MKDKRVKKLKTLPKVKENIALEKEFEKKLREFSKKCFHSFSYWLLAKVNQNRGGLIKIEGGKKKTIQKALREEFDSLAKRWELEAELFAGKISTAQTGKILRYVKSKFKTAGFGFDMDMQTKQVMKAQIEQQMTLIKSIPSHIMESCQSIFLNNISSLDRQAIEKSLKTLGGITARRAKTIARDQTHKALTNIVQSKAMSLGAEYYMWVTSNDERVSKGKGGHSKLDGRIYRYDTPSAVIDTYGNVGHTGQRVNCRCIPVSVFLEPNQEAKLVKDGNAGDYYIIVEK